MANIPVEYYSWLDDSVHALIDSKPLSVGISAILPDGNVLTAYYNADQQDKALMANNFFADAMLDVVINNIEIIKEALEE